MRNLETLARTLAYLIVGLLALMAIMFILIARELILAARQLRRWFAPAGYASRHNSVATLERSITDAPIPDPDLPLLPGAVFPRRRD